MRAVVTGGAEVFVLEGDYGHAAEAGCAALSGRGWTGDGGSHLRPAFCALSVFLSNFAA